MVDAQPTENTAVEPRPPGESDAPLMGNPVLTRANARRPRRPASARRGWALALPVVAAAAIILAGAFYFFAHSSQNRPLLTNPPAAAPAASAPVGQPQAEASMTTPTAAPAAPTKAAAQPAAAAPRHEHVTRLARAERGAAPAEHRPAVHHARAAEDEGANASATAPEVAPKPAAPNAPPVLSPPPAQ